MGQKWTPEQHAKFKATMKAKRNKTGEPTNNGQVTAAQLLERLKVQRDFMNDIVDMIEEMMK